ncbi:MAG: HD domain-containing protein [Flavobacteriales bacterium]
METLLEKVEQYVKAQFIGQEGSHDWQHIDRVRRTALKLQKMEGGDALVIELAALLHDISDHKYNGGDFDAGPKMALELLQSFGCTETLATNVGAVISVVSYKGALVADSPTTLEGQIVRDADRLDAIGAIGIARAFAYGGSRNRALYLPEVLPTLHDSKESYAQDKGHTINHFYEKLLLLKDRMETQSARLLAAERHEFMLQFLKQFKAEWS